MTHSAAAPARKPSRMGLYAPYVLLVLFMLAWSGAWLALRANLEHRLDATADRLRAAGWQVAWSDRRLSGYPFRLDLDFTDLRLAEPSGWGLEAPALKTEAYAFMPQHWMLAAPAGVTLVRPGSAAVRIDAAVLRASISGLDQYPPRFSLEGEGLTFTPAPGAKPFAAQAAAAVELHTAAGPDDQGALFVSLDKVQGPQSGLLRLIAGGKPFDLTGELVFSHASAARGRDWPNLLRNWSRAGGVADVRQFTVTVGQALLASRSGTLTVDPDGRIAGAIGARLTAASPAGPNQGQTAALGFQDGKTLLGPLPIGPAPRLY